jgi:uncharacterized protein DUF4058
MVYSDAYVKHATMGPFPGQVDPWAEVGRYFHQIHGLMIDNLITQLHPQLVKMGYLIGKEASLQIAEGREPDIFVQRTMNAPVPATRWDYGLAASEILADAGEVLEGDVDIEAIHVKEHENGRLVTIVEIISPNNKTKPEVIADYRARRERLVLEHSVNVVEIDLTRSIKRLVNDSLTGSYAYQAAIYLPGESPRLIGNNYGQSLKRIALPLRAEVVPIELQTAYDYAYQLVTIAAQIDRDNRYREDDLPFPSLLTDAQKQQALQAVAKWRETLNHLKSEQA